MLMMYEEDLQRIRSRCVTSAPVLNRMYGEGGHVIGSSLSDLKYSLTSCRFRNRDFCMMLIDKCFHVMEFPVLLHYSVFLVHLSFLLSGGIWYCWYSVTRSLQVQPCMGSSFLIYFYYKFILASIRGYQLTN